MPKVPKEKLRKYPHMLPNDIEIWERFLRNFPALFDRIDYDLHVGDARGFSEGDPDWKRRLAEALTKFRIDAVGWQGERPTIIEVKPYASLSALGQLLGYRYFFQRDFPDKGDPYLMAVTDKTRKDIVDLYYDYEVIIYQTDLLPAP